MEKLNPAALADFGDGEDGSQEVTEAMILDYVLEKGELPPESARPFAKWLDEAWNDFGDDGGLTVGQVLDGALSSWCGGREK